MVLVEGALFGLAAALLYGTIDFFGKKVVDQIGDFPALLYTHGLGFIPILLFIIFFFDIPLLSQETLYLILLTGFLMFLAWFLFYKGLAKGMASIIVPIAGAWGAMTTILALTFLGEQPSLIQLLAMVTIFVGVILTAVEFQSFKKKSWSKGVGLAFLAFLFFGLAGYTAEFVVEASGPLFTLFSLRLVMLSFFLLYTPFSKIKLKIPKKAIWPLIIFMAVGELFAMFFFYAGLDTGMVSVVSAIVAAYASVTVVLAYIFLKERIYFNQKIGIILTVLGLIGVSLM